jgi:hypothetical protein
MISLLKPPSSAIRKPSRQASAYAARADDTAGSHLNKAPRKESVESRKTTLVDPFIFSGRKRPSQFLLTTPCGGNFHCSLGCLTFPCYCWIGNSKKQASSAHSIASLGSIGVFPWFRSFLADQRDHMAHMITVLSSSLQT